MSTTPERKAYASDLTNEQWQIIEPLLPEQKEGGRGDWLNLTSYDSFIRNSPPAYADAPCPRFLPL
jgi:hypothetical protein